MSQRQTRHQRSDDEPEQTGGPGAAARQEGADDLDGLIDDIDMILEDTVIVEQYVQKGGQ